MVGGADTRHPNQKATRELTARKRTLRRQGALPMFLLEKQGEVGRGRRSSEQDAHYRSILNMKACAPSLLLFDLGGVLIDTSGFDNLNRMMPRTLDSAHIKKRWLGSPSVRRFELGEISAREFADGFIAEWELSIGPSEFLTEFISWPKGFYPGARELISDLRRTCRVGCLSNSNALHWAKFNGFKGEFDIALSSHLLGAIKPDPSAFTKALLACGAQPREVLFFDDMMSNVSAAQSLGIQAFHVDDFQSLVSYIKSS